MSAAKETQKTQGVSRKKPAQEKPSQPKVGLITEELRSSSGELASTLGPLRASVIENHHHAPGGHGPDPDGSEVVDAAGDVHSDDRDVDDSDDAVTAAVNAAVEHQADVPDIENVGRLPDEDVEESERLSPGQPRG